jgi:hypothetical protein
MRERQLELGLGNERACRFVNLRGRRHRRRHEWFERMRQVVDNATDREERSQWTFQAQTTDAVDDH